MGVATPFEEKLRSRGVGAFALIITFPAQLRRSLTWDQGTEMAQHARLKIDAGVQLYFCDSTVHDSAAATDGLLRQYFPKGTDLSMHTADEIAAVAAAFTQG